MKIYKQHQSHSSRTCYAHN